MRIFDELRKYNLFLTLKKTHGKGNFVAAVNHISNCSVISWPDFSGLGVFSSKQSVNLIERVKKKLCSPQGVVTEYVLFDVKTTLEKSVLFISEYRVQIPRSASLSSKTFCLEFLSYSLEEFPYYKARVEFPLVVSQIKLDYSILLHFQVVCENWFYGYSADIFSAFEWTVRTVSCRNGFPFLKNPLNPSSTFNSVSCRLFCSKWTVANHR